MMKFGVLCFVLLSQMIFCQTAAEKLIHIKLVVDSGVAEGVTIVNLVNEKSAVSDAKGEFYILVKMEDLLVFSSKNLEYYRRVIDKEDLKPEILVIKMMSKITQLDEVIIDQHPEINAVSLGIIDEGMKYRTAAEKRLYTANSRNGDQILNAISGRTAIIKKEIKVEKKNICIELLDTMFKDSYFTNSLKIPLDYIKGFKYYIVDNDGFTGVLMQKNKTRIEILMIELAVKYKEIISNE